MVVNIAYISTTDLQQLHSALHTTTTLSITATCSPAWPALYIRKFMGKVSQRMVYFLRSKPITRSICILTRESCLTLSTSTFDSCLFPLVKGGITSSAQCSRTLSAQVKPRSAITWSPGRSLSSRPQFSMMNLSVVLLPHACDTNVMTPCGAKPIKYLIVLCDFKC